MILWVFVALTGCVIVAWIVVFLQARRVKSALWRDVRLGEQAVYLGLTMGVPGTLLGILSDGLYFDTFDSFWNWSAYVFMPGVWLASPRMTLASWLLQVAYYYLLAYCALRLLKYWKREPPPGHCHKCGYCLTGNLSGVCPECGIATTDVES